MQTFRRRLLVITICLAVSVFVSAGESHAKKGGSKVKVEVEAELEPFGAQSEPDAEGKAEHKKETRKGVVKKDEFKGKVKIPIDPTSQLGITDEAAAENADIRLILSRNGAVFAECLLEFDEVEDEDGEDRAEYKVDVRIKKGAVRAKKGVCDMDPTTAAIDLGVPDAMAGDMVTATLVVNSGNRTLDVDFLQGTFEPH